MTWRKLVLVVICAFLAFGGSFTCIGSTGSTHFTNGGPTTR